VSYDALVIAAHPDDAETQMGGTLTKLTDVGQRLLLVDPTDGEPTEFAEPGVRAGSLAKKWGSREDADGGRGPSRHFKQSGGSHSRSQSVPGPGKH
jgi:hypothetical protein